MAFKRDILRDISPQKRSLLQARSRFFTSSLNLTDKGDEECTSDGSNKLNNTDVKDQKYLGAEREKKYKDNKAEVLHEKLKHADSYMEKVTKIIKLSELYEIADYYYTSETQKICPVLLKIKH